MLKRSIAIFLLIVLVGGLLIACEDKKVGITQEEAVAIRVTADATQIEPIIIAPIMALPMMLLLLIGMLIPRPRRRRLD